MPSLREIRGHIRSVTGIAQVVHAIEAVSSVTAHRLQERVDRAYLYAESARQMLAQLAEISEPPFPMSSPETEEGSRPREGLVLISSNRGMAGAYDQNVLMLALRHIEQADSAVEVITIGSRGHSALLHRDMSVVADWSQLNDHVQMDDIAPIAALAMTRFREQAWQRVSLVYTHSRSTARHTPAILQLLPITGDQPVRSRQFYYEPSIAQVWEELMPRAVQASIYLAILESLAAEHAARAVAMRSASNNATELVGHLRLNYNKSRQEAITAEMNQVSSALATQGRS